MYQALVMCYCATSCQILHDNKLLKGTCLLVSYVACPKQGLVDELCAWCVWVNQLSPHILAKMKSIPLDSSFTEAHPPHLLLNVLVSLFDPSPSLHCSLDLVSSCLLSVGTVAAS